ncbi:MAG: hypothetical protein KDE28_19400, partial [Anaerolineales bacterium]|nr:hypothetical protein [Anaerolineales bacterium]
VNENPTGTTKAIGEAVNMAFSKAWKKTSFQRFGHQLKSWSTFEGPKRGVGGWGIISDEHQLLIEKLIAQKICASNQIYEKLGVSQITLNRWRQSDDNTKFTKSGKWAMRNSSD